MADTTAQLLAVRHTSTRYLLVQSILIAFFDVGVQILSSVSPLLLPDLPSPPPSPPPTLSNGKRKYGEIIEDTRVKAELENHHGDTSK